MAGKPDGRVCYVLDEVQNAGAIPILRTALAEYNGYGLQFLIVLQDFDKMIMNYTREGLQSMIQNCDVICCFGGDPIMAERVRRAWYMFTDGFSRAVEAREDPDKI